jgi:hypothetical protein
VVEISVISMTEYKMDLVMLGVDTSYRKGWWGDESEEVT